MNSLILCILYIIFYFVFYKKQNKKISELSDRIIDLEVDSSNNVLRIIKLENKIDENKIDLIKK